MNDTHISIVTGTLNRRRLLEGLIANTVDADPRLELVLVDGGSTDGSVETIRSLAHPRIKLIEVGCRSPYPHFMNLGVRHASHELVCQWNDDALLASPWSEVFDRIDDHDAWIFAWKVDRYPRFKDKGWILLNTKAPDGSGEIVMNYGIYRKDVFRKIGMYNAAYRFYCADGDMAQRAWHFGFRIASLPSVKVISLKGVGKSQSYDLREDWDLYQRHIALYAKKQLPANLEYVT